LHLVLRFHEIAERRHDVQNPVSVAKVLQLGAMLRLDAASHVLDIASGTGGPATLLAREFGCRVTCVEYADGFVDGARRRANDNGVADRIEIVHVRATEFEIAPRAYDAALCLGASFVYGGLLPTLAALTPGVRAGGYVAVGEVFWHAPPPGGVEAYGAMSFADVFKAVDAAVPMVGVIASSTDDWDAYESLHYQSVEDWLAAHPDDDEIRAEQAVVKDYFARTRGLIGWAVFTGRILH
jgi:predicted O-methyltransferase YrrM